MLLVYISLTVHRRRRLYLSRNGAKIYNMMTICFLSKTVTDTLSTFRVGQVRSSCIGACFCSQAHALWPFSFLLGGSAPWWKSERINAQDASSVFQQPEASGHNITVLPPGGQNRHKFKGAELCDGVQGQIADFFFFSFKNHFRNLQEKSWNVTRLHTE